MTDVTQVLILHGRILNRVTEQLGNWVEDILKKSIYCIIMHLCNWIILCSVTEQRIISIVTKHLHEEPLLYILGTYSPYEQPSQEFSWLPPTVSWWGVVRPRRGLEHRGRPSVRRCQRVVPEQEITYCPCCPHLQHTPCMWPHCLVSVSSCW